MLTSAMEIGESSFATKKCPHLDEAGERLIPNYFVSGATTSSKYDMMNKNRLRL